MSEPRFLADEDLRSAIRSAVLRQEPRIHFATVRGMGWGGKSDDEVLELAAVQGLIVVSHDMRTMPAAAYARMARSATLAGLLLAPQTYPIRPLADELVLIWGASTAEEWVGRVEYLPL